jgi:hypothetical protein
MQLVTGDIFELPLSDESLKTFEPLMAAQKREIVVVHYVLAESVQVVVPVRSYPYLQAHNFIAGCSGDEVTTRAMTEACLFSNALDDRALALRYFSNLMESGLPIIKNGDRTHRTYRLPVFSKVFAQYVEEKADVERLKLRYASVGKTQLQAIPRRRLFESGAVDDELARPHVDFTGAACRNMDSSVFTSPNTEAALAVCGACTVVRRCLARAKVRDYSGGVWGGQYFPPA